MSDHDPQLILLAHPLSSYCWKVLIPLYENDTPFAFEMVGGRPSDDAAFVEHWPIGRMPLLRDLARDTVVAESTIIIEYLQRHYPGAEALIPDGDPGLEARLWDRFFDLYVHTPVQRLVGDRMRAADSKDPAGVAEARAMLDTAYAMLEARMVKRTWAANDAFSLADCAATPALFYAAAVHPYAPSHAALKDYFERLISRPAARRAIREARPYFQYFPFSEALDPRFVSGDF